MLPRLARVIRRIDLRGQDADLRVVLPRAALGVDAAVEVVRPLCEAVRTGGEQAVLDPAVTVTRDVGRLRSAPAISPRVTVSGHVYDVVSGLIETVLPAGREANQCRPAEEKVGA